MTLVTFLRETKAEMSHVKWPTKKQIILFTTVVVIVSLISAYALAGVDSILNKGLTRLLA